MRHHVVKSLVSSSSRRYMVYHMLKTPTGTTVIRQDPIFPFNLTLRVYFVLA